MTATAAVATTRRESVARPAPAKRDEAKLTLLFTPTGENVNDTWFGANIRGCMTMKRGAFRGAPRMTRVEIEYEAVLQCGTVLIRPTGYRGYTGDGAVAGLLTGHNDAMRPFVAGVTPMSSLVPGRGEPIEQIRPYVWYPWDVWSEIVNATTWRPQQVPQKFKLKAPFTGMYLYSPSQTKNSQTLKFDVHGPVEIKLPKRAMLLINPEEEVRCGDYFAEVELPVETTINRAKRGRQEYERLLHEQQERIFTRSRQVAGDYMKYAMPDMCEDGVILPAGRDSILPALLASTPLKLRKGSIPAGFGPYESAERGPLLQLLGQGRILWNISSDPQRFETQVSLARLRTERSGVALEVLTMPWSWRR